MNAYECTALSKALPHTDQDAQEGEFTLAVESMPAVISPPAPSLAAGWKNRLPSELFFEVYALCCAVFCCFLQQPTPRQQQQLQEQRHVECYCSVSETGSCKRCERKEQQRRMLESSPANVPCKAPDCTALPPSLHILLCGMTSLRVLGNSSRSHSSTSSTWTTSYCCCIQ